MMLSKVKPAPAPAATVVAVAVTDAEPAANDDSLPIVSNDLRNPLWIIAIGMACFFGAAAAVMGLS